MGTTLPEKHPSIFQTSTMVAPEASALIIFRRQQVLGKPCGMLLRQLRTVSSCSGDETRGEQKLRHQRAWVTSAGFLQCGALVAAGDAAGLHVYV